MVGCVNSTSWGTGGFLAPELSSCVTWQRLNDSPAFTGVVSILLNSRHRTCKVVNAGFSLTILLTDSLALKRAKGAKRGKKGRLFFAPFCPFCSFLLHLASCLETLGKLRDKYSARTLQGPR